MSFPSFIIFKEARRFQAGYLDLKCDVKVFTFQGRDYRFVGQCPFYHQITDQKSPNDKEIRLIGFAVDRVTHYVKEPRLLQWIEKAENVYFESDTAFFYISWPHPVSYDHDGSTLIAANFFCDTQGDFLITIADGKANDESGQFQNLWTEIAFPLAPAEQFVVKE
jgi:hypothetical protein